MKKSTILAYIFLINLTVIFNSSYIYGYFFGIFSYRNEIFGHDFFILLPLAFFTTLFVKERFYDELRKELEKRNMLIVNLLALLSVLAGITLYTI